MEIECCKCQRKFIAIKEDNKICPECLRAEFAAPVPKLNAVERAELVAEYKASIRRQSIRAENMGGVYASGNAFNVAGTLRLVLGLGIFAVCAFLFLISDRESGVTFLAKEDIESQRLFSMIFCVVSAGLVATASVYYKKTVYTMAVFILAMGWLMPNILEYALNAAEKSAAEIKAREAELVQHNEADDTAGPVLNDADLQVFYSLRSVSDRISHYAVFIDNQNSRERSLVRDALTRLLQSEYTRAYTRANGALYVVTNVAGPKRNISQVLSRFGTVTYAVPDKGVYEVRFDADKANLVSQYSPDVLTTPMNPSYVTANLSELKCLDPMRVRMSARSLAHSNVRVLRGEIRNTLLQVLNDPWDAEPDTYSELVEALVVYSQDKDTEATNHCYKYFSSRRALKREVSPSITRYLILQKPDVMVEPIVDMWCENPIAWNEMLNLIGLGAQRTLIGRLKVETDIRLIGTMIKFLQEHGTTEALPAIEPFLEHADSIIRHSAKTAYSAIQERTR